MIPLLYSLHSGNLYGTERMALATADGLAGDFTPVIIAPPGPVHAEARRRGYESVLFEGPLKYALDVRRYFASADALAAVGTRVLHSAVAAACSALYRKPCANLQVVHGGADERLSYGRKRWLSRLGVRQIAVSEFVRERLIANGSAPAAVTVIENFLEDERIRQAPKRAAFHTGAIRRALIVSRLDPIKRIDLLFEAIDLNPSLRALEFRVLGNGSEESQLRARAASGYPNVQLLGYRSNIAEEMSSADLLLHLCPEEPFGLAILEAMAAGLPVLVPNRGGAGSIVIDGRTGFHFDANDTWSLAERLEAITRMPAATLNAIAAEGLRRLQTRYSAAGGAAMYRRLITECWA